MRNETVAVAVLIVALAIPVGAQNGPPATDPPRITAERLGNTPNVVIVDARRPEDWSSSDRQIAGAWRGAPDDVAGWAGRFPLRSLLVVYCD